MEQNFARNFYTNKENFWSQEVPKGGTWVGTTQQGQVGATHLVAPLTTPLIL